MESRLNEYAYICDQKRSCSYECLLGISACRHTLDPKHAKNPLPQSAEEWETRFERVGDTNRFMEVLNGKTD